MAEKKCYEFDPVTKVFEFEDIVYDTPLEEKLTPKCTFNPQLLSVCFQQ